MSKLLPVQILRALAALSVAILHAQYDAQIMAEAMDLRFEPLDWLPWAAGVDVFFVISGFVMVHASQNLFGIPEVRGVFLIRRIVRIVPLYWAVTTLYLVVALVAPALLNRAILEPWPVLASYLFIPFARPDGAVQPLYSLGWTLNYEMFFYGLFAVALVLQRRQAVVVLMAGLTGLVLIGSVMPLPQPFAFWTNGIVLEFAFGLALGLLRTEGFALGLLPRVALTVLAVVLLAFDLKSGVFVEPLPRALAWGGPAAFLVAAAVLGREVGQECTAGGFATRLGVTIGDASYALYLLHPFAIRGGRAFVTQLDLADTIGLWGFVFLALVTTIIVALVVHRLLERPATEWVRRRLERSDARFRRFMRGDATQRQHS